jgi:peptidoglycan hydrolase-like protein with peptidoglycan-binding domain
MTNKKNSETGEAMEQSVASPAPVEVPAPRTLIFGTQGEDVKALQRHLIERGEKIEATGVFGYETFHAMCRWQRENRMPETGYLTPGDLAQLPKG